MATDRPHEPVDTKPDSNVASSPQSHLFDILSEYPILRHVLPYLNQYDLSSLRASCKTLRENLPATSNRLGLVRYRCANSQYRWHADYPDTFNQPLRPCGGPRFDSSGVQVSVPQHTSTTSFWVCGECVHRGAEDISDVAEDNLCEWPRGPTARVSTWKWLPICTGCFALLNAMGGHTGGGDTGISSTMQTRRCGCILSFRKEVVRDWFCQRCAREKMMSGFYARIENSIQKYRTQFPSKGAQGRMLCGRCKESKRDDKHFGHWMCGGCEDIMTVKLRDLLLPALYSKSGRTAKDRLRRTPL